MVEARLPKYIDNINEYIKTTGARGLILHTSAEYSPYSDFDFFIVYGTTRERNKFVGNGKEHVANLGSVMPARLILNWINPYGGVNSLFDVEGETVKIDISPETMKSIQKSNGILQSSLVYDTTGKLGEILGTKKDDCLRRNFYTPPAEMQSLLEQFYGYYWNAFSKLYRGDYRIVAFEFIPAYLGIIAKLEHACNGEINTNFYNSEKNMRPETAKRLDDIDIRPQRGALISTLEKLQSLFQDLGRELADKNQLIYPEEAEMLAIAELDNLKKQKG